MLQNIKVDIIYYKTNTDFEMEFNLCGCCRMRLLTDKVSDKKTLVHSMARAVSRSRVIIIAGCLFGEDGVIKIAADAIGTTLCNADSKTYGISGEETIEILKGSTPLVSPDGYFGGCIIESGPQTMILVSDNKNVRKGIMQSLIHPYIEEISSIKTQENPQILTESEDITVEDNDEDFSLLGFDEAEQEVSPLTDEEDSLFFDADPEQDETQHIAMSPYEEDEEDIQLLDPDPEQNDTPNIEIALDQENEDFELLDADPEQDDTHSKETAPVIEDSNGDIEMSSDMLFDFDDEETIARPDIPESDDDEIKLFTLVGPKHPKDKDGYYSMLGGYENDSDFVADDDLDDFRRIPFRKGISLNLPIIIISILLLVLLAVLCYCLFYVPSKDGVSASAYIRETFQILFG